MSFEYTPLMCKGMLNFFSVFYLTGKLATKDASNACSNQNSLMENAGEALDLDEIRSIIESKHKNDDDMYLSHIIYIF